jgi:pimeloyl-ACP methyl ester carboxylesterase
LFAVMAAVAVVRRPNWPTTPAAALSATPLQAGTPRGLATTPAARQAFADLPGVRLWFTDTGGTGEPVVLMHAITGTSESWQPQIATLAKLGYRVVAFDRRGWGKSLADPATGPQPGHASEDLHALADYLSLDRFHLVGVAGGGFVALDYAAWHGDRLRSLVVGASTGSVSDREIQDFIARIEIPACGRSPRTIARSAPRIEAPTRRACGGGSRSMRTRARRTRPRSRCVRRTPLRSWPPLPCVRS